MIMERVNGSIAHTTQLHVSRYRGWSPGRRQGKEENALQGKEIRYAHYHTLKVAHICLQLARLLASPPRPGQWVTGRRGTSSSTPCTPPSG